MCNLSVIVRQLSLSVTVLLGSVAPVLAAPGRRGTAAAPIPPLRTAVPSAATPTAPISPLRTAAPPASTPAAPPPPQSAAPTPPTPAAPPPPAPVIPLPAARPLPAPPVTPARRGFRPQAGMGMSLVLIRGIWANNDNVGLMQAGLAGHVFVRAHPRLTPDLTFTLVPTLYSDHFDYWIYEFPILASLRIHLERTLQPWQRFQVSPYLLVAAGIDIAQLFASSRDVLDQTVYFEAQLGAGAEFRIKRDFALMLDARGIADVRFSPLDQPQLVDDASVWRPALANTRAGAQLNATIASYF